MSTTLPVRTVTVKEDAFSRTETRTGGYRVIGTCKVCRKAHTAIVTTTTTIYSRDNRMPTRNTVERWPPGIICCGRHVALTAIKGTTTSTPCDERCTSAKGHRCECSCGGKNHGADH